MEELRIKLREARHCAWDQYIKTADSELREWYYHMYERLNDLSVELKVSNG